MCYKVIVAYFSLKMYMYCLRIHTTRNGDLYNDLELELLPSVQIYFCLECHLMALKIVIDHYWASYLFIYCHLYMYSAFSIVTTMLPMLNAQMRCTGYEMVRYKGTQASHLYEKSMNKLCTISEQRLLAEASTNID